MFDGLDPRVIRVAGKLSAADVVMDDDVSATMLRLHDWASDHLDSVTRALRSRLGTRAAWTHTTDRRTRAALLALAEISHHRAATNRAAAESWRGQIDDAIVDEWRDQGLANVDADDAKAFAAAARSSSDAPTATAVQLDLLIRLVLSIWAAAVLSLGNLHARLRRLPHVALSPRLSTRPRVRRVLTAAA